MDSSDQPPSSRKRNLALLWVAQFVSGTGNSMFSVAIGFLVMYQLLGEGLTTDTSVQVGLTRAVDALPFLLFGAYAGVLVDRYSRRRLMAGSDLLRALILAAVPILYFSGVLVWWMLPVCAFAVYSFSTVFNPARDAIIPDLAEGADLIRVNSFFQTSTQLAFIVGAAAAAGLLSLMDSVLGLDPHSPEGPVWLLTLNACTFLVSFVCILAIRPPLSARVDAATAARRKSSWRELIESYTAAWKDARLRALLFLTSVDNFFIMGPAIVGGLYLVTQELGLGAAEYGIYEACLGAGWLVGTLLIARFGAGIRTGRLVLAGMLLDGLTYIPFFWISSYGTFLFAIFVHGLSIPLITVGRTTMIQRHYPRERLGRIFALVAITVQGFTALSLFAAGVALRELNAKELYLIAGVCGAACGVIGLSFKALRTSP